MSITIRHNELNECFANPSSWVSKIVNKPKNYYSMGYDRILRESVYTFHNRNDYISGKDNIEIRLERNKLHNQSRIDGVIDSYEKYALWLKSERVTVVKARHKLRYMLGSEVILGGTISRIDITPTGYRGIIFGKILKDWQLEVRMPLLQRALAFEFGRTESQFEIGWQDLSTNKLETRCFAKDAIDNAEFQVRTLASEVAEEYKRQKQ